MPDIVPMQPGMEVDEYGKKDFAHDMDTTVCMRHAGMMVL
jgi:hypothetical protein